MARGVIREARIEPAEIMSLGAGSIGRGPQVVRRPAKAILEIELFEVDENFQRALYGANNEVSIEIIGRPSIAFTPASEVTPESDAPRQETDFW